MTKKTVAMFLSVVLTAVFAAAAFAACGNDDGIPADMSGIVLTDGGVEITLTASNGETSYDIYKCGSAYGEYVLVESGFGGRIYESEDVWAYYRADGYAHGRKVSSRIYSYERELFGGETYIFSPDDDPDQVQAVIDGIYSEQRGSENGQFAETRAAIYFKPGVYDVRVDEGYYTSVAGLGMLPTDTDIADFNVDADIPPSADGSGWVNHNATCNFWRSVENIEVSADVRWAVSQATSMRRVKINGDLTLHHLGGWSSGGFLADSVVGGTVDAGSQQQWLSRNDEWTAWNGTNFNMVFVGTEGAAPEDGWPGGSRATHIAETPAVREKPFLVFDERDGYGVFVPAMRTGSVGASWSDGKTDGEVIPLSEFYVARADRDDAASLNAALSSGRHVFLTAGIYELDEPLEVTRAGTVVMGSGYATLRVSDANKDTLMRVADEDGIIICGLLFDAGAHSETLLEVGGDDASADHSDDPICLSDLFFRIGGRADVNTYVRTSVIINSDDVIGDNFWVWRADHTYGVGWDVNVTKNGLTVNGDDVTFYGLLVEHFHEYQTVWRGERGRTYFYQSEIPYDPPSQDAYMSSDGTVRGYASYKVDDGVRTHTAYGLGVYSCPHNAEIKVDNAIEVPANPGIRIEHAVTVLLDSDPCIQSVINGNGTVISPGWMSAINVYDGGSIY